MRAFDWLALLQRQRIPYVERGANVKRGEVNIKCPWCGSADPSQHLGLNLSTGFYACWRQRQGHSGKSPLRLIMMLLRCSYGEAREIAGLGDDFVDPEGFDALAARLLRPSPMPESQPRKELSMPDSFLPIDGRSSARRWDSYLIGRGFLEEDLDALCYLYDLRACRTGDFRDRLILPYYLDGKLVTWTGRAIAPATLRYKDLSIDESIVPVKETLYNRDVGLVGGKVLALVEGPMDALKVDFYGRALGLRAVAMSTNSLSDAQTYLLEELAEVFDELIAVMDNKTDYGSVDSMRMQQNLAFLSKVRTEIVPAGRGDPGELSPAEVKRWALQLTRGNHA